MQTALTNKCNIYYRMEISIVKNCPELIFVVSKQYLSPPNFSTTGRGISIMYVIREAPTAVHFRHWTMKIIGLKAEVHIPTQGE